MIKKIATLFLSLSLMYACTPNGENGPDVTDNFDRKAMLTHIADNIIIPSYDNFAINMETLVTAGVTFSNNPTEVTLEDLRSTWLEAYKSWQYVEMFNIGRAEELQYSFFMNVFPLTVTDVEENIADGTYDLNSVNNQDAQGFPALDYLLFGVGTTTEEVLGKYTTVENSENYKKYLIDVLNQMNRLTKDVVAEFKSNKSSFVNNDQNTATSTVNKLVNDYIFYYEKGLRRNKIGLPAGIFSANPLPDRVEAYYNKEVSKTLALEALKAVQDLFEGNSSTTSTTQVSFKAYLVALQRQDLVTAIENQFASARTQINTLNPNFISQIATDNSQMLRAYDELQKAVILLKVDMLQAFNISVDFVDSDGD